MQRQRPTADRLALTGPAAAAAWGLDGFRDHIWVPQWCAPISSRPAPGVIRTRNWREPVLVGEQLVAPIATVLRHLGDVPRLDGIDPEDRIELARARPA